LTYRRIKLLKLILIVPLVGLLAAIVMLLWNWVMPGLYAGIQSIDYWHALGLLVLSRILLGGMRGQRGWHAHRHWQKWQHLQSMTAQERETFFQQRKHTCRVHERD